MIQSLSLTHGGDYGGKENSMQLLRKYWRHFNMVGAIATFLFGMFWVIWGINAEAPYNGKMDARLMAETKIETLRSECYYRIRPGRRLTNKPPLTRPGSLARGEAHKIQETAPLFVIIDKTDG